MSKGCVDMMLSPDNPAAVRQHAGVLVRQNRGRVYGAMLVIVAVNTALQTLLALLGVTGSADEPAAVTLLSNIVTLLVSAPLQYGFYALLTDISGGRAGSVRDIFSWFSEWFRLKTALLGTMWFGLIAFCWLFIYILPASFVLGLLLNGLPVSYASFIILYAALLAVTLVALAHVVLYMPGAFMLAEEPARSVTECFSAAKQGMRPYKWKFFGLIMVYALQMFAIVLPFAFASVYLAETSALLSSLLLTLATALAMLGVMPRMYMGCICYYQAVFGIEPPEDPVDPFAM